MAVVLVNELVVMVVVEEVVAVVVVRPVGATIRPYFVSSFLSPPPSSLLLIQTDAYVRQIFRLEVEIGELQYLLKEQEKQDKSNGGMSFISNGIKRIRGGGARQQW